jgi:hypothetical protein
VAFTEVLANAAVNGINVDPSVLDNLASHDITVDGGACVSSGFASCRRHPFTGQVFSNEMAVSSWNLMMLAVALGASDGATTPFTLDRDDPLALGRCSFRQPQYCAFVSDLVLGGIVPLSADGTYTIHVGNDTGDTGGYALELDGEGSVCATPVEVDVKPGAPVNPILPLSHGVVPVAILGSEVFDVADVDATTLAFGPAGAPLAHQNGPHTKDANHDGIDDLLAHFRTQESGIVPGDEAACVTGELLDGTPFEGCDSIRTVPSR